MFYLQTTVKELTIEALNRGNDKTNDRVSIKEESQEI